MSKQRKLSSTSYPMTFIMVDSTDHITGKTGLTPTVTISKNGGSYASPAGAVTEIGNGEYALAGNATDRNTLGEFAIHATATGADMSDERYEVVPYDPFAQVDANVTQVQGVVQTGGDIYQAVQNIAVTSAALNATASSRSITTGTGSGGVANTTAADLVYDNVSDSAGTLDFYYEFNVSGTNGAVGVGVGWLGYVVGLVNTIKVYAFNWGGASWDQIGTVVGIAGTINQAEDWELTSAHTGTGGNLGLVRIRFSATGLTSATVKTDRILLGYAVVQDISGISTNVTAIKTTTDKLTIRIGTAQGGSSSFITLDAGASSSNTLYVGELVAIASGTGAGQTRVIASYNGTTKNANVDRNWVTAPDNTSVFVILPADAPALNVNLQVSASSNQIVIRSGTAQAGSTSNTIKLDAGASATSNIYSGNIVTITGGTGLGQTRTFVSYNGSTKVGTVDRTWTTIPDGTSTFNILANITPSLYSDQGVAQAGTTSSITLASTASSVSGIYVGSLVTILSGTDAGNTSEITAYNGSTKVATVSPNFSVAPDTTSAYAVIPTQSGTGSATTQDVNVLTWASTPVSIGTAGKPSVEIDGTQTFDQVGNITGTLSGSVGSVAGNVSGNVNGSVGSVIGSVGSVLGNLGGNVVGSVGSVLAGVSLTAGAVQAIWDALTSALITSGSIGKLLVDGMANVATILSRITGSVALQSDVSTIEADLSNLSSRLPASLTTDGYIKADTLKINGSTPHNLAATDIVTNGAIQTGSGAVQHVVLTDTITTYTGNTPQTGDSFLYAFRSIGRATVAGSGPGPTTTAFTVSAITPSGVDADQFKGRVIIFDNNTTTAALRGQATAILGNSSGALPVFTVTALTRAPVAGDTFSIV